MVENRGEEHLLATSAAIILPVSAYSGELNPLPGCVRDGQAVSTLVNKTGKFEKVLVFTGAENSSVVKERLADFVKELQSSAIDELMFYFTGHGSYQGGEFYYLLSDFKSTRRNTTALTNSELDGLVRSLNPAMFVKIVDACQSGVSYIKGNDELEEFIKGKKEGFRKLYFMFSSNNDQFSYQSSQISDFTEGLLSAVVGHQSDRVRYKDLISSISDRFQGLSKQTPFFVSQADFTEVFCEVSHELKESLSQYVAGSSHSLEILPAKTMGLVDAIRSKAEEYATKEEAEQAVNAVHEVLIDYSGKDEIDQLYDTRIETHTAIPERAVGIGKWLQEGKAPDIVFAQPVTASEPYTVQVPKNPLLPNLAVLTGVYDEDKYKTVTQYKTVVKGYKLTTDLPFAYISITLDPLVASIAPEAMHVAVLASRRTLYLFHRRVSFSYTDWSETNAKRYSDWQLDEVGLKDGSAVTEHVRDLLQQFRSDTLDALKVSFLPKEQADAPERGTLSGESNAATEISGPAKMSRRSTNRSGTRNQSRSTKTKRSGPE